MDDPKAGIVAIGRSPQGRIRMVICHEVLQPDAQLTEVIEAMNLLGLRLRARNAGH